jgi:WD40 repeat protein
MADPRAHTPSLVERVRPLVPGGAIVGAHFLGTQAVFVLGEEALVFAARDGTTRRVAVHGGAILASAADSHRIVTGGDDGRVLATAADGATRLVSADAKRRWIDNVAIGADGAVAWSAGRTACVRTATGTERTLDVRSTVGGLAFAPKGLRLAISHYDGVSLWFPNASAPPQLLSWHGSHLAVRFSPDGRFLISAMQEPALHGWRLADGHHMRMSGYSARVRSLCFTADRAWLATSGAEALVLWPFQGKDGPTGKAPRMLASTAVRVSAVACHPREPVVAVGYADGLLLLVRIEDGAEILVRRPDGAAVSALAWDADGHGLAFGTEDGAAGILLP